MFLFFVEYLHPNSFTDSNISNYLAGIRAFYIIHGLPTDMFRDQSIRLFVKSLESSRPLMTTPVFTNDMLKDIVLLYLKY